MLTWALFAVALFLAIIASVAAFANNTPRNAGGVALLFGVCTLVVFAAAWERL